MDLRYLRYFIAVAEDLNFTRAAKRLNTVQPSLSQQIKRLEEIIGTPLFLREKHQVQLTESGRVFLVDARNLLELSDRAITHARQVGRAAVGSLALGVLPSHGGSHFGWLVHRLLSIYPEIHLQLLTLPSQDQLKALREKTLDIGIVAGPIEDPGLEVEPWVTSPILAVLPADHPLAALNRLPVARLAELPLICPSRSKLQIPYETCCRVSRETGVTFSSTIEVDSMQNALDFVEQGAGFTFIPERIPLPPSLVAKHLEMDPEPSVDIRLVYCKDGRNPVVGRLLSLIREQGSGH